MIVTGLIVLELVHAMKDYDYMRECTRRPRDYFLVTGEGDITHYVAH